jgi:transcriptional regulator with XRE-family HTH domain
LTSYGHRRIVGGVKRLTLRQARKRKGWTQHRLAEATRALGRLIDQRNISKIEAGDVGDVMNSTAETLELALGVPRGTLVFGREDRLAS